MDEVNRLYEELIDRGLFTEDELQLVTDLNGYNIDTLNDCLYCRYGYRSYDQMVEED